MFRTLFALHVRYAAGVGVGVTFFFLIYPAHL